MPKPKVHWKPLVVGTAGVPNRLRVSKPSCGQLSAAKFTADEDEVTCFKCLAVVRWVQDG